MNRYRHDAGLSALHAICGASGGSVAQASSAFRDIVRDGGIAIASGELERISRIAEDVWRTSDGSRTDFATRIRERLGSIPGGRKLLAAMTLAATLHGIAVPWVARANEPGSSTGYEQTLFGDAPEGAVGVNMGNAWDGEGGLPQDTSTFGVYSGGSAANFHIPRMRNVWVYSGGVISNVTIDTLQTGLTVLSGGSAVDVILLPGDLNDRRDYFIGGKLNVTVAGGGTAFVTGSATVIDIVDYWDENDVYSALLVVTSRTFRLENGIASGFVLHSGAHMDVNAGGSAIDILQRHGGNVNVAVVGDDSATFVIGTNVWGSCFSMASGIASGFIVYADGHMDVSSGGSAVETTVYDRGHLNVSSGGWAGNVHHGSSGNVNVTVVSGDNATFVAGSNGTQWNPVDWNGTEWEGTEWDGGEQAFSLSNGVADHFAVYNGGYMNVSSGGIANKVLVFYGGNVNVTVAGNDTTYVDGWLANEEDWGRFLLESGVASNFVLYSGGHMDVSSGGSAFDVRVYEGGNVNVTVAGGEGTFVNGTIWAPWRDGQEFRLEDDVATNFVLYDGGRMYISSGGTAQQTWVSSGGRLEVYSDGNARETWLYSGGRLEVFSGGSADSTTVDYGGRLYVSSGGSAFSTTVGLGGTMTILAGGSATDVLQSFGWVNDIGFVGANVNVTVASGDGTFVEGTGEYAVFAGEDWWTEGRPFSLNEGVASGFILYDGGSMGVSAGGSAQETWLSSGGRMDVSSGGLADSTTIFDGGRMHVSDGGSAVSTTLEWGGRMDVSSGGLADSTTVSYGGRMEVSAGGSATDVRQIVGRNDDFVVGGTVNVTVAGGDGTYVTGMAEYLVLESGEVWEGEGDERTLVSSAVWGTEEQPFSLVDGVASSFILYNGGRMDVTAGGSALETTIYDGGRMDVSADGSADSTTVRAGGAMNVSSGGSATEVRQLVGGNVNVTVASGDTTFVSGTAEHRVLLEEAEWEWGVNEWGELELRQIKEAVWDTSARAFSLNDGVASGFALYNGGRMDVSAGGSALETMIYDGGRMDVSGGGSAGSTVVWTGGAMNVLSGGSAVNVSQFGEWNGWMSVGGNVNVTVASGDTTFVSGTNGEGREFSLNEGVASNFILYNGGHMEVSVAGSAVSTTVHWGGFLDVVAGGSATSTRLTDQGRMDVHSDVLVDHVVISEGGRLFVSSGGIATSVIQSYGGGLFTSSTGLYYPNYFFIVGDTDTYISGSNEFGSFTVESGVANSVVFYNAPEIPTYFIVSSGGTANHTFISGLDGRPPTSVGVERGGVMSVVSIYTGNQKGGLMYVNAGGSATSSNLTNYVMNIYDDTVVSTSITAINGWRPDAPIQNIGTQDITEGSVRSNYIGVASHNVIDNTFGYLNNIGQRIDYASAYDTTIISAWQHINHGTATSNTIFFDAYFNEWEYSNDRLGVSNVYAQKINVGSAIDTIITGSAGQLIDIRDVNTPVGGTGEGDGLAAASSTTLLGGAWQEITDGNYFFNAQLDVMFGSAYMTSIGGLSGNSGGYQTIGRFGEATSTYLSDGAWQDINAGTASATSIFGGSQVVSGGIVDFRMQVYLDDGAADRRNPDGKVSSFEDVVRVGSAMDTTIFNGGQIISGGQATSTNITNGYQVIIGGARTYSMTEEYQDYYWYYLYEKIGEDDEGNPIYDRHPVPITDENGDIVYSALTDENGEIVRDEEENIVYEIVYERDEKGNIVYQYIWSNCDTLSSATISGLLVGEAYATIISSGSQLIDGGRATSTTIYDGSQTVRGSVELISSISRYTKYPYTAEGHYPIWPYYPNEREDREDLITETHTTVASMMAGSATSTIISGGWQSVEGGTATATLITNGSQMVGGIVDIYAAVSVEDMYNPNPETYSSTFYFSSRQGSAQDTSIYSGGQIVQGGQVTSTHITNGSQILSGASLFVASRQYQDYYWDPFAPWLNEEGNPILDEGGNLVCDGGWLNNEDPANPFCEEGTPLFGMWSAYSTLSSATASAIFYTEASDTVIESGWQLVDGARATSTTIRDGSQTIAGGEQVIGTWVESDVTYSSTVSMVGSAIANILSGGAQYVNSDGYALSTHLVSGASQHISGGLAVSNIVSSGGAQFLSDGSALSTVVEGGAAQTIFGGVAEVNVISADASQTVSGGTAVSTLVNGGGSQIVLEDGSAYMTDLAGEGAVQTISSGGSATSTTVASGASQTIFDGGTATATEVSGGGWQIVSSGGNAVGTVVSSGGVQALHGASAAGVDIQSGASQILYAGATDSGTRLSGNQLISSGGEATSTLIESGGSQAIFGGGVASDATVSSGGLQDVFSGGAAIGTTVSSGGVQDVSSGGTAIGTTVSSGGVLALHAGNASAADILSGGSQVLHDGASDFGTNLSGNQLISSGGSAVSTTVASGASQTIFEGGTATAAEVSSGGLQIVSSAGTAVDARISSGGSQIVEAGGTASGTTIFTDGTQIVSSAGSAISTRVNSGGSQVVSDGAIVQSTWLMPGAYQEVDAIGSAFGTVIDEGASQTVSGGAVSNTLVRGSQTVMESGTASNTFLEGGGLQTVSGGSAFETYLRFGGSQTVSDDGIAIGTEISSGGRQDLFQDGSAHGTIVSSGGVQGLHSGHEQASVTYQYGASQILYSGVALEGEEPVSWAQLVSSGGSATSMHIVSGGSQTIFDGGVASDTTVSDGGWQIVSSGGSAVSTTVSSGGVQALYHASAGTADIQYGGTQILHEGATDSGTVLSGNQLVSAGGQAVSTRIDSGGSQTIFEDGVASGTEVSGGGWQIVSSGGSALATVVLSGGVQEVHGASTYGADIQSGGSQVLLEGAMDSGTVLYGSQFVSSGGSASATLITSDGSQTIFEGGTATSAEISSGGQQTVSAEGLAIGTVVSSGGVQELRAGSASATDIRQGGSQVLYEGARDSGTRLSGVQDISSGGSATATQIAYGGSQTIFEDGSAFDAVVSDGGSQIVSSGGIAIGTTVSFGGVQELYSASAEGADIQAGGSQVLNDGARAMGGTLVGVQIVSSGGEASGVTVVVGGSQTISSGGQAIGTQISSGGSQIVRASGLASAATIFAEGAQILEVDGSAVSTIVSGGASQTLSDGAMALDTHLMSGGSQAVLDRGTAIDTHVSEGGAQIITSGGVAVGAEISSGGRQDIFESGSACETVVSAGGRQDIFEGGSAIDTVVSSGGIQGLHSGYRQTSTTYLQGGSQILYEGVSFVDHDVSWVQIVSSGGGVSGGSLLSGGSQLVSSGGSASAVRVESAASQAIFDGGVALDTVVSEGGWQVVSSGGSAIGTIVSSGGVQALYSANASTAEILQGGSQILYEGATDSGTQLSGVQLISGGVATSTTVVSGGAQNVYSGGIASSTTVLVSGALNVDSGGIASGATVEDHGNVNVFVGGSAVDVIQSSGGNVNAVVMGGEAGSATFVSGTNAKERELSLSGGIASGFILYDEGYLVVSSGGNAIGTEVSSGGLMTVVDSGMASVTIVSTGGQLAVAGLGIASDTTVSSGGALVASGGNIAGTTTILDSGSIIGDVIFMVGSDAQLLMETSAGAPQITRASIAGSGAFHKLGEGTQILAGENSYEGATVVSAGTLAGNIAEGTDLFVSAGAIYAGFGADGTASARIVGSLEGQGAIQYTDGFTVMGSGVFEGSIDSTNKGGITIGPEASLVLLGDANAYRGATTITGGGTLLGNIASNTDLVLGTGASYGGGVYDSGGDIISRTSRTIGDLYGARDARISDTNGLTVTGSGIFAGDIDSTNSGLTMAGGAGKSLVLAGNNSYSGATTITSGGTLLGNVASGTDLILGSNATYGGGSYSVAAAAASPEAVQEPAPQQAAIVPLALQAAIAPLAEPLALQAPAVDAPDAGDVSFLGAVPRVFRNLYGAKGARIVDTNGLVVSGGGLYEGDIDSSNKGGLTKDGEDELILTGLNNTYTGGTFVVGGKLTGNINESEPLVVSGGATYDGAGVARSLLYISGAGTITNVGGSGLTVAAGVFDGQITETPALTKIGPNMLILNGDGAFSGSLAIRGGTLTLGTEATIIPTSLTLWDGTTFDFSRASSYDASSPSAYLTVPELTVMGLADVPAAAVIGNLHLALTGRFTFNMASDVKNNDSLLTVDGNVVVDGGTETDPAIISLNFPSSHRSGDIAKLVLVDVADGKEGSYNLATLKAVDDVTGDIYGLRIDDNDLVTVLLSANPKGATYQRMKAYAESRLALMALINQGGEYIAYRGMSELLSATRGEGLRVGAFGGADGGKSRYDTGSHIDLLGQTLLAGIGLGGDTPIGRLSMAAFFDMGTGTYRSHNDFPNANPVDGKGNVSYWGGGLLVRLDNRFGLHFEGIGRYGRGRLRYETDDIEYRKMTGTFDTDADYYGAIAGLGWNFAIPGTDGKANLDLTAKAFWTQIKPNSTTVHGDRLHFEDARSLRLRAGGRLGYALNDWVALYVGAYYEREFEGDQKARINGRLLDTPSLRGNTGIGEIGLTVRPFADSIPLFLDIGVQGFTGTRTGLAGNIQIRYEY